MSDLISRQEAISYSISGMTREIDGDKWIRVSEVRESIKAMPSAQPERKTGKWNVYYHGGTNFSYSCNQCGAQAPFLWKSKDQKKTRYCYNCGARMEDPKLELSSLYGKCVSDGQEI